MQNVIDKREAFRGGEAGRKIALAQTIRLAVQSIGRGELHEDDRDLMFYEVGFKIGQDYTLRDLCHVLQGVIDGLEHMVHELNDNQKELPLE
jgi:hypothetical protein